MNFVPFGPTEVRELASGGRPQCTMAILTSHTCAEPCWYAHEDVCRCSCGGKNHGCLRANGGIQPVRNCRLDGFRYLLESVGQGAIERAREINSRQYKHVEKPIETTSGFMQYKYSWRDTHPGALARIKFATVDQVNKWPELAAYRGDRQRPALCWIRETMPEDPTVKTPLID